MTDTKLFSNPVHEHDCDKCHWLGTIWSDRYNDYVDLYFHPRQPESEYSNQTVIARFGVDGDYSSGMCFNTPDLLEAKKRAIALGMLDVTEAELDNSKLTLGEIIGLQTGEIV